MANVDAGPYALDPRPSTITSCAPSILNQVKERPDEMAIVEAEILAGRVPFYPECYDHPDPTKAMLRRQLARSDPPPGVGYHENLEGGCQRALDVYNK